MKAQAIENILAEVLQMDSTTNVTIHTKSGEDYTFNVGDNEELVPEHIEINGVLQVFCDGEGTAWIDTESIEAIRI